MINNNAILKTVLYGDIFDYPLSQKQIWRYLISSKSLSFSKFKETTRIVLYLLESKNGLYSLVGRDRLFSLRKKRARASVKKLSIAKKALVFLCLIPTIKLIGISGSLALNNAKENDDIDLFVITKVGSLWFTRLLILFVLELLGLRRKRNGNFNNTICLNMLVDEKKLSLPYDKRNLYIAHEVAQLRPLFQRGNTYGKFLFANLWVLNFLPNSFPRKINIGSMDKKSFFSVFLSYCFTLFESPARMLQMWYMRKHMTKEIVNDHYAAFHPRDHSQKVIDIYNRKVKAYNSLLERLSRYRNHEAQYWNPGLLMNSYAAT